MARVDPAAYLTGDIDPVSTPTLYAKTHGLMNNSKSLKNLDNAHEQSKDEAKSIFSTSPKSRLLKNYKSQQAQACDKKDTKKKELTKKMKDSPYQFLRPGLHSRNDGLVCRLKTLNLKRKISFKFTPELEHQPIPPKIRDEVVDICQKLRKNATIAPGLSHAQFKALADAVRLFDLKEVSLEGLKGYRKAGM